MESLNTFYTWDRMEWRAWLAENFEKEKEVWLVFPKKESGEKGISYNDAVEEALCFGWIDSTVKKLDASHRTQRFSPRRKGSGYSRANIERLIWLESQGMLHPKVRTSVLEVINKPYVFPMDILESIRNDRKAWENYESFPASYQRIRIAYIDGARKRPEEFKRRLENFIRKTRENKLLGYGGIDKYYIHEQVEEKKLSIDEYILKFPPEIQETLQLLRKVIKESAPDAKEKISYQMPAFVLYGNLVYFAAYKNHIGFYPTSSGIDAFKHELSEYKSAKGSVQFPIDKPLPYELISRIVKFRVAENIKKAEEKLKKKK